MGNLTTDLIGVRVEVDAILATERTRATPAYAGKVRAVWHGKSGGLYCLIEDIDGHLHETLLNSVMVVQG